MLFLALVVFALWIFRLSLVAAALRSTGVEEPKVQSLQYRSPDTLAINALAGRVDGIDFLLADGSATLTGWRIWGDGLHLKLMDARLTLPERFPRSGSAAKEKKESTEAEGAEVLLSPLSSLPEFAITLENLSVLPPKGQEPWARFYGEVTSEYLRELHLAADSVVGDWTLESRFGVDTGEGRIGWRSAENPDWEAIFPTVRRWGIAIPEDFRVGWRKLEATLEADWSGAAASGALRWECELLSYGKNNFKVSANSLKADLRGQIPFDSFSADSGLTAHFVRIEREDDWLEFESTEGLIQPTAEGSDLHLTLAGGSAHFWKISIQAIAAEVSLTRNGEEEVAAVVTGKADAFSGKIEADLETQLVPFSSANVTVDLSEISAAEINERFRFFEGGIEAKLQGKLQAKWENDELTVLPSTLEMVPGTEGTLRYENDGWMTGDPDLDVEALSGKLRIDQLLTRKDSAGILVELAARNLTVTRLRIALFQEDLEDREGEINLEGFSMVQDTKIPVVLTVPLRGDLQEAIRLLLQAGRMM